jgi:hypothetical protein
MAEPNALDVLIAEEERLMKRLDAVRMAKKPLEELDSQPEPARLPVGLQIRPNDFVNMKKEQAVAKLLGMLGRPATLVEMLPLLERGGCDLGKQKDRYLRNLKIAVRMNSKPSNLLIYDDKTDTVSIRRLESKRAMRSA